MTNKTNKISFQGELGAFSHLACKEKFPHMDVVPCITFDDAINAVKQGKTDLAMIPIDNTIAGRVADVHRLLPKSKLHIIGEFFLPINHCLLVNKGNSIENLKEIHSHVHAINQCRNFSEKHKLKSVIATDTAGSAKELAENPNMEHSSIASQLAGEIYGLDILHRGIQDENGNVTRFIVLSPENTHIDYDPKKLYVTSLMFNTKNIPAALYKVLGGFATNDINLTKLESYFFEGSLSANCFYMETESHTDSSRMKNALKEINFFADNINILGTYQASSFRKR